MLSTGFRWEVLLHCNKTFFQLFYVLKHKNKLLGTGITYNQAVTLVLMEEVYITSWSVNPHECKFLQASDEEINLEKLT